MRAARAVSERALGSIGIRIRHPNLDPALLTQVFGIEPLHSFRAGDPRRPGGPGRHSSHHGASYWLAEVDVSALLGRLPEDAAAAGELMPRGAREAIARIAGESTALALSLVVRHVLSPQRELLARLRAEEGEVTVLCGIAPGTTESLPPQLLQLMGELGVSLCLEIESPDDH